MASMRRALENSLASVTEFGDEGSRLAEINSVENPVKRAALLATHAAVAHFGCLIPRQFYPKYPRIGSGARASVHLYDADTVFKVVNLQPYLGTGVPETKTERKRWAGKLQEEHDIMASYLGGMVAPHRVEVDTNPIDPDNEAILIWQPYHSLDYLTLSDIGDEEMSLPNELQAAERDHPGTLGQLQSMVRASRRMLEESGVGLITDVVGKGNVGIEIETLSRSLVITDAQPIPKTDGTHEIALDYFEELETALEIVA